jgi:hypothetical protein
MPKNRYTHMRPSYGKMGVEGARMRKEKIVVKGKKLGEKEIYVPDDCEVTGFLSGNKEDYDKAVSLSTSMHIPIEKFMNISLHLGIALVDEILSSGDNMERFKKEFGGRWS